MQLPRHKWSLVLSQSPSEQCLQRRVRIDQSHITTTIWWPLGVVVVSVTCMRVHWVSHTWKYTQHWNIFLFESRDTSPYWTNLYHIGFRYEASLNFQTHFGQCPSDTNSLLHIPLDVCPNYPHTVQEGLSIASSCARPSAVMYRSDISRSFSSIRKDFKYLYLSMSLTKWYTCIMLTHCGLVMPYGDRDLGQHWRHQAITWTTVDLSSIRSSGIHLRAIS